MQWQQAVTVTLKPYKTANYTRLARWQTKLTHWNN